MVVAQDYDLLTSTTYAARMFVPFRQHYSAGAIHI